MENENTFQLISFDLQMEPLFPKSDLTQVFVHDFCKDVIKRLMPKRTLAQILTEAENVEDLRLNPAKIQKEYEDFLDRTLALQRVLRALNVCSPVTRFSFSHPFAIGLGEVAKELARKEEASVASGEGPIRMCTEPPYVGGDPNERRWETNPGVEESRFSLWRDLRAMYTRCVVVGDHHKANEYFLFERLQVRWDEVVRAKRIARVIRSTPGHECVPKNDICLKYRVSTDLLLYELRYLERVGQEVILPVGARWGPAPKGEKHCKQYECEFCGIQYYAAAPM